MKIRRVDRVMHRAQNLAAARGDRCRCGTFEVMAERVVAGDKEPAITARCDHRADQAVGQRPIVECPLHCVRRAALAGQLAGDAARGDEHLVRIARDVADRERDRRIGYVEDDVDAVDVEPPPRHGGADIDFVLMVAGDHLDRSPVQLAAKILSRELCRDHRAHALEIGINTRHVV
jgi:hypothetical protein